MKTPEDLQRALAKRYDNEWRDWLGAPPLKPFSCTLGWPGSAGLIRAHIEQHDDDVAAWARTWAAWSAAHPEALLRTREVRTSWGAERIYTHVELHGAHALAALTARTRDHWACASRRYPQLTALGCSHRQLSPILSRLIDLTDADFELLLQVVTWFTANPRSGKTLRQVNVPGLHTKWLARHRGLVTALLHRDAEAAPADDADADELSDEVLDQLGLKPLPVHVDVILADPHDRAKIGGIRHVNAPISEIAALPLRPERVLIVENKESALPIGDRIGLVIIHSLGNHISALEQLPWIPSGGVWYWGDLDRHGLTLLSRARAALPRLQSVLMDSDTLRAHRELINDDGTLKWDPPYETLTATERESLHQLTASEVPKRLEQERLPWAAVEAALQKALA
ncbi:Wadjet anti-phage system protein JetD domain-containing protein [Gryllotalpicola koreensis]|uniref:DUF3322 and DUF2220 domain-containing protein n=1 Tax=Gryllotalpicola koreensis TaxID=993086 RepID=A0ABP7ZQI5_9MICO